LSLAAVPARYRAFARSDTGRIAAVNLLPGDGGRTTAGLVESTADERVQAAVQLTQNAIESEAATAPYGR